MTTVSGTLTQPKVKRSLFRRPTATTGFSSWFTTVDHKKIGIMYAATAMAFLVIGGIEALLIRLQLAGPNGTVLTASQYNTMFTMHGTTMVFLMGMPLAVAFGNYLIPLQIGARDVAFPRLERVRLLGGALRRPVHLLELLPRRRAERRVVRLHAPHEQPDVARCPPRPRTRLLDRRPDHARHRLDHVGGELHRDDPQHARAGDDAHAHAGVHAG